MGPGVGRVESALLGPPVAELLPELNWDGRRQVAGSL